MKNPLWYWFVLAVLAVAPAVLAQEPQPALVRVGQADVREVRDHRLVTGRLNPVRESRVAAEEAGLVIEAPPDAGTVVKVGDVLAKLDTLLIDQQRQGMLASLAEARAVVNQTRAALEEAQATLARFKSLAEDGGVTQVELDQATRDAAVAAARVAVAQAVVASRHAQLQQLDIRIAKMTIAAPYDGVITAKSTELGQWLDPGDQVVQLVAIDRIDAVLDVPETAVGYLSEGQPIDITVDALDRSFPGVVHRIVPAGDQRSRTFPVMIRLDNPEGVLKPGMSAEAMLPTADVIEAITVPRDAVQLTPAGAQVVVNRDGVAQIVSVQVKFSVEDRFVVEGSLTPGDQVVIEGNERVFPGTPLTVLNSPQATP